MRAPVFPELVTGRLDGLARGRWRVREGSTRRGEASCDLAARVLEVPLGADATSRVVRAHELMHVRVSPLPLEALAQFPDVAPRALECAEEFRVNTLLARLDFDVARLTDGSEKAGGRHLGEAGEWGDALCFLLAVLGTGAERPFLAGVRAGDPAWVPALRAVRRRVLALAATWSSTEMGATEPGAGGVGRGYAATTVVIARLVTPLMSARVPVGPEALRAFRRSLEPGGRRPPTGRFATLRLAEGSAARPTCGVDARRRWRPATSGTTLRYPGRLLTDPSRRAFATPGRGPGGVVVLDQSGSMDLSEADLAALRDRAPRALVVGYSHRPGDLGVTPNAWVLVERGRVASEWPAGNVGNGVDAPALRWALSRRRGDEPVVWVTDGQVTDSHDHPGEELTAECADLVRRHRIRLVRGLDEVPRALRSAGPLVGADLTRFGRLGRKLQEISRM